MTVDTLDSNPGNYNTEKPDWFDEKNVVNTIDIRDMIHTGEQPVHEVLSAVKKLNKNEIFQVITPFIPAPLLDKSLSIGTKHWLDKKAEEEYWVFFHL